MHHLKSPHERARGRLQRDHGIRPLVIPRPGAAVVIGAGAAGGDEDHVSRRIGCQGGPRVGRAGPHLLLFRPRNRIPRPPQYSGTRIVRTHHSAGHIYGAIVADGRAGDYEVSDDDGSGCDLVIAAELGPIYHATSQIHYAARAEVLARLARLAVEGDQPRIDGPFEYAQLASRAVRSFGIGPCGDAARGNFGISVGAVHLRIVDPFLAASRRVQGDYPVEWRAQIQRVSDQDRCGLESRFFVERGFGFQRARVIGPYGGELCDVFAGDLLDGGISRDARIGRERARRQPHKSKYDSHNRYCAARRLQPSQYDESR